MGAYQAGQKLAKQLRPRKVRLTALQAEALIRAHQFGRVIQGHGDGFDHQRPNVAGKATLWSLVARGLLIEWEGPRYMPEFYLSDLGEKVTAELVKS